MKNKGKYVLPKVIDIHQLTLRW